jgi:hypothetical protein
MEADTVLTQPFRQAADSIELSSAVVLPDKQVVYRLFCIYLILLVGAGRFERPTPCAQGSSVASKGSICYGHSLCLQQLGESAFRSEASPRQSRGWGFGTVLAQFDGW